MNCGGTRKPIQENAPGVGHTNAMPLRTTSRELLGSAQELIIEHNGREYRLRVTQRGKLILTA